MHFQEEQGSGKKRKNKDWEVSKVFGSQLGGTKVDLSLINGSEVVSSDVEELPGQSEARALRKLSERFIF